MESASCELVLKPSLYNNRPIHSNYFRPGNTRIPRYSSLARGNTHFPRTWCLAWGETPTFCAPQSRPKSTPTSATWFREPPYKPAWPQETPYTTVDVFPVDSVLCNPKYQARAGIPLRLWGLTSTFRTLYITSLNLINTPGLLHPRTRDNLNTFPCHRRARHHSGASHPKRHEVARRP